jgi:hypothetical protein
MLVCNLQSFDYFSPVALKQPQSHVVASGTESLPSSGPSATFSTRHNDG